MSRGQIWLVSTFTTEQGSPGHQHRFHPKGLSNVDSGLGRQRKHAYKLLCVCICEVCVMCGVCVVYVWCTCVMCVWSVCGMWCVYVVCGCDMCVMCMCVLCVWYACEMCDVCVCGTCVCRVCNVCVWSMCMLCVHEVCCVCAVCVCDVWSLCVWSVCVCAWCMMCVCALSLYVFLSLSIPYGRGSSTYSKFICKSEKWNTVLAFHISFLFWPL